MSQTEFAGLMHSTSLLANVEQQPQQIEQQQQQQQRANSRRAESRGRSLLQAHIVNMGVGLIHYLLLEQLLNDILDGNDAHWGSPLFPGKRCCA